MIRRCLAKTGSARCGRLRQSSDTQIKSVLNDDQQKNFDKMREEQANRMKRWAQGRR